MDLGVRAARTQIAQERLMAAAQKLAKRHGLEDDYVALEEAQRGPAMRDPAAGALLQREALADFLEHLLAASGRDAKAAEQAHVVKDQQKVEAIHKASMAPPASASGKR